MGCEIHCYAVLQYILNLRKSFFTRYNLKRYVMLKFFAQDLFTSTLLLITESRVHSHFSLLASKTLWSNKSITHSHIFLKHHVEYISYLIIIYIGIISIVRIMFLFCEKKNPDSLQINLRNFAMK